MENKLLLQDIAEAIATKGGLSKKNSEAFVKALFETIEQGLTKDKFVKIKGFGTFKVIAVGERESVNINTGERFFISGHDKITFTPDNSLKDLVNRPFAHFQTVILNDDTDINELERVDELVIDSPKETTDVSPQVDNAQNKRDVSDKPENSKHIDHVFLKEENKPSDFSTPQPATSSEDTLQDNIRNENDSADAVTNTISEDNEFNKLKSENSEEQQKGNVNDSGSNKENDYNDSQHCSHQETSAAEGVELPSSLNNQPQDITPSKEDIANAGNKENDENLSIDTMSDKNCEESKDTKIGPHTHQEQYNEPNIIHNTGQQVNYEGKGTPEKEVKNNRANEKEIYIANGIGKKRNIWKNVTFGLLTAFILLLTYFAGYFKIFCPCEFLNKNITTEPIPLIPPISEDSIYNDRDSLLQDTTFTTNTVNDSISSEEIQKNDKEETIQTTLITTRKPQELTPTNNQNQKHTDKIVQNKKSVFKQVEGGKYEITGTLRTHKIERGETIRTIAQDVYGSKGYAVYIIAHNELINPNLIDTGTVIKLPKLKRK